MQWLGYVLLLSSANLQVINQQLWSHKIFFSQNGDLLPEGKPFSSLSPFITRRETIFLPSPPPSFPYSAVSVCMCLCACMCMCECICVWLSAYMCIRFVLLDPGSCFTVSYGLICVWSRMECDQNTFKLTIQYSTCLLTSLLKIQNRELPLKPTLSYWLSNVYNMLISNNDDSAL